jgi:hypothetical protein
LPAINDPGRRRGRIPPDEALARLPLTAHALIMDQQHTFNQQVIAEDTEEAEPVSGLPEK